MDRASTNEDILGNKFGEVYRIMTDHTFERRLEQYDPNLKLMFDQRSKRWKILEWSRDNSGWRILMTLEDDFKNPASPGDWVFFHLHDMRKKYEEHARRGDNWIVDRMNECDDYREKKQQKLSEETQYKIKNDIIFWKKAAAEFLNEPKSDVTAGYPKIMSKTKGNVCR